MRVGISFLSSLLFTCIALCSLYSIVTPIKMKALKCKTLGASVMYVETLYIANIIYTYIDGNIHVHVYIRGQMRVCTGTYTYMYNITR